MALALGSNPGNFATGSGNPVSQINITLAADSKVLTLFILNPTTTARAGGAPTFGAGTFTQAGTSQAGPTEFNVEIWYLLNPSLSASTLSIPNSDSLTLHYYYVSFTTTAGATYFNAAQGANTTADPSLTINNVPAGGACVAVLADGYKSAPTSRSHTALKETDMGAYSYNCQYGLIASLSNVTMSWTVAADNWSMVMAAFQEGVTGLNIGAAGSPVAQTGKVTEELTASVTAQTARAISTPVQSAKLTEVLGAEVMAPVVEPRTAQSQQSAKLTEELSVSVAAQPVREVNATQSAKATEDKTVTVAAQTALAPDVFQTAKLTEDKAVTVSAQVAFEPSLVETFKATEDNAASIAAQPTLEVTGTENALVTEDSDTAIEGLVEDMNVQATSVIHVIDYVTSPLTQSFKVSEVVAAEIQEAVTEYLEVSGPVETVALTEDKTVSVATAVTLEAGVASTAKVTEDKSVSVAAQPTLSIEKSETVKVTEEWAASTAAPVTLEPNVTATVRLTEVESTIVEGLLPDLNITGVTETVKATETTVTQVIAQLARELAAIDSVAVVEEVGAVLSAVLTLEPETSETASISEVIAASVESKEEAAAIRYLYPNGIILSRCLRIELFHLKK